MLATKALDDSTIQQISEARHPFGDPSLAFYIWRMHGNQFLFNGIDRASQNTLNDDRHLPSYTKLYKEILRRFPFLADVKLEAAWGGATQQTITDTPIVQASSQHSNLFLNIGYGGSSGIGAALASGRLVTELVLGEQSRDHEAKRMRLLLGNSRFPIMEPVRAATGVIKNFLTH